MAFMDPKRSMVDIIQAVGRVIRKAAGKQIGTIVIPVFIDESEDADHVLSQSAFEPVWQVLKALRAHGRRTTAEGSRGFQPTVDHPAKPSRRGATIEPSPHDQRSISFAPLPHLQSLLRDESFL